MSKYVKAAENLQKNTDSGIYYVRARVNNKIIKKSTKTTVLKIAKARRDELLNLWRTQAGDSSAVISSFPSALSLALEWYLNPHRRNKPLKEASVMYYKNIQICLLSEFHGSPRAFSVSDAQEWWTRYKRKFAPQRANNGLGMAKRMGEFIAAAYPETGNVFLELKRTTIPQTVLRIPEREEFLAVIKSMRDQGRPTSEVAACFFEFLAFSGLRLEELRSLRVEDIQKNGLIITGGERGTKNGEQRFVPLISPMQELLTRMELPTEGLVFRFKTYPKKALYGACDRLGMERMSPHKFRHFFSTMCMESGVDPPTLAKWLGHKDGGILVSKTYAHIRDKHSEEMAAQVRL